MVTHVQRESREMNQLGGRSLNLWVRVLCLLLLFLLLLWLQLWLLLLLLLLKRGVDRKGGSRWPGGRRRRQDIHLQIIGRHVACREAKEQSENEAAERPRSELVRETRLPSGSNWLQRPSRRHAPLPCQEASQSRPSPRLRRNTSQRTEEF